MKLKKIRFLLLTKVYCVTTPYTIVIMFKYIKQISSETPNTDITKICTNIKYINKSNIYIITSSDYIKICALFLVSNLASKIA